MVEGLYYLMIRLTRFGFSTIALISGAPKYDHYLHSVASTLQKESKVPLSFVGVVGSEYQSPFSKVYASSALLDNHQFEVTRAYNTYSQYIQDCPVMPYRTYTHLRNYFLTKELQKQHFFEQVFSKQVSAVVTFGNFSLALRISEHLNQYCKTHGKVRPYTAFFHRQVTERTVENEEFLDFQYYNVEKTQYNAAGYVFPSLCVGYDGLYRAFQHLQTFKKDNQSDSFISQNFSYDVTQLVLQSRAQFRKQRGISEDKFIIYIDAGINAHQVKFSFKSFKDGLHNFLANSQISAINSSHFEIFVHVPSTNVAEDVKSKLGFLPNNIKVTLVPDKDKYGAISVADFGLLHNGEATVQAAALQLPSLVVDSMSNIHAYFNNLYNGHASPLNIATNYQAYEDLTGSLTAIGTKIGSIILKNFQTPKLRYYYAKLYREQIQLILSKSHTNPRLCVTETGLETGCKHLLEKAAAYSKIGGQSFRKESERKEALAL